MSARARSSLTMCRRMRSRSGADVRRSRRVGHGACANACCQARNARPQSNVSTNALALIVHKLEHAKKCPIYRRFRPKSKEPAGLWQRWWQHRTDFAAGVTPPDFNAPAAFPRADGHLLLAVGGRPGMRAARREWLGRGLISAQPQPD